MRRLAARPAGLVFGALLRSVAVLCREVESVCLLVPCWLGGVRSTLAGGPLMQLGRYSTWKHFT